MTANKFKTSNYWIIGKHAVIAALNNKRRAKYRLCITPENQEKININILELKPEIMSRSEISKLTDNDFHQGIALLTKPLEKQNLNSYLKQNIDIKKIFIILDQINDSQNIGAIIRSAAAFSVSGIIMLDKNSPNENSTLSKAAVGTLEIMPIFKVNNLVQTIKLLKKNNFWTIGLEAQATKTLKEINESTKLLSDNVAIAMGSESKGLRNLVKDNCDITARINIKNSVESLNVSVALGISVVKGKFIIHTKNKEHVLEPGDSLSVNAKQLHSEKTSSQGATILLGKRYKN